MGTFLTKWGLVIKALVLVLPIVALKAGFHYLDLEVIAVGPIITALVAGVFFVIAIILSGVMADFKESEKMPGDLTASIEALYKDSRLAGDEAASVMLVRVRELTRTFIANFERKGSWKLKEVNEVIDQIDEDIRVLAGKGVQMALIMKLRNELGNIKKISNRVEVIKEVTFLPAGQALAEFAMGGALLVLLLLKVTPVYEGMLLIGVVALIMTSVILLIKDMDNPFEGHATVDLRQLYKLGKYLDTK